MSTEFLQTDFEKVSYLASLLTAHATGKDASDLEFEELRHELLSNSSLQSLLPSWLKVHRNLGSFWGFIQPKFGTYADRRKFLAEEFSPALSLLEFGHIVEMEKTEELPVTQNTFNAPTNIPPKKKIFIVHGRDNESKQELSRYIESLGIDVIILHEQASSGMTIIEKIEHYSNVGFGIVIYTPCDIGSKVGDLNGKYRSRQNVVFEHGFFIAKLGRENVTAVVKGDVEKPNDISGVVYETLDDGGAWKFNLAKEMKASGCQIDMNDLF